MNKMKMEVFLVLLSLTHLLWFWYNYEFWNKYYAFKTDRNLVSNLEWKMLCGLCKFGIGSVDCNY